MALFGLILFLLGILLYAYLNGVGADVIRLTIAEKPRGHLITMSIAMMVVGVVLMVLGVL